jgi:hypothetical protein
MVAWNRHRIRTNSGDRAGQGRFGELGKLGRREGKGRTVGAQMGAEMETNWLLASRCWDARAKMVEKMVEV